MLVLHRLFLLFTGWCFHQDLQVVFFVLTTFLHIIQIKFQIITVSFYVYELKTPLITSFKDIYDILNFYEF